MTARVGGKPLRDTAVLQWASDLIHAVLLDAAWPTRPASAAPRNRNGREGSPHSSTVGP